MGSTGDSLRNKAERLVAFFRHAHELEERERGIVRLLAEARKSARVRRRRAGALGFGDLFRAARDGLRDRPDLAETVRADVDVLLVDEFQDTSRVQRDLVYLLREREEARRGAAPETCLPRPIWSATGSSWSAIASSRSTAFAAPTSPSSRASAPSSAATRRRSRSRLPRAARRAARTPISSPSREPPLGRRGPRLRQRLLRGCDFSEDRAAGTEPRDFEIDYGPAEHLAPVRPPPSAARWC